MMERIHDNARFAYRIRDSRAGVDRDVMHAQGALVVSIVLEGTRNFRWNVLYQRSTQGDVENLRAAADCEYRLAELSRRSNQRNLGPVAILVRRTTFLCPGLSIKRRIYIFAPRENETVDTGNDRAGSRVIAERRNYQWYEPCTLE